MNHKKFATLLSIAGPIIYAIVVLILASLRPGYNHITQFMSELGETGGSNAIFMNVFGFGFLGLTIILFAYVIHNSIKKGKGSLIAPALFVIAGLGVISAGIFSCDPGCADITINSTLHGISAIIPGVAMSIASIFLYFRMREDPKWANYALFTLAIGIATGVLGMFFQFTDIPGATGLIQRIAMGVPLFWMVVTSIKIHKMN